MQFIAHNCIWTHYSNIILQHSTESKVLRWKNVLHSLKIEKACEAKDLDMKDILFYSEI